MPRTQGGNAASEGERNGAEHEKCPFCAE